MRAAGHLAPSDDGFVPWHSDGAWARWAQMGARDDEVDPLPLLWRVEPGPVLTHHPPVGPDELAAGARFAGPGPQGRTPKMAIGPGAMTPPDWSASVSVSPVAWRGPGDRCMDRVSQPPA